MFDYPYTPEMDMGFGFMLFYLIYMLVMAGISIGSYVLQSVGFYAIAKRRGIKNPWLSWIPVGNVWILGCISDQFQYVVKGKVKNKRKALLTLNIVMVAVCVIFYVIFGAFMVQALVYDDSMLAADHTAMFNMMGTALGMLALALIIMGLTIAVAVIQYIALYDLFSSCDPGNNVLFLLLSIFVNISLPILVFICRKKDLGMPPRKPEPEAYIPPAEPWEQNPEM